MKANVLLNGRGRSYRRGSRGRRGFLLVVFVLALAALSGVAYLAFRDLEGPSITLTPPVERIGIDQQLHLHLKDTASAVKSVLAVVRYSGEAIPVFERRFATEAPEQTLDFNLKEAGLKDGVFMLEITARDTSLAGLGRGNSTTLKRQFVLDTQPPKITLRTPPATLRRGGVAVFVYSLSEDVERTGVQAAERFFPAFPLSNGLYACFLTFPMDALVTRFTPEIHARDLAGNEGKIPLPVHLQDRAFNVDRLNIVDAFLTQKAMDFEVLVPEPLSSLERYIKINKEVRLKNEATLRELAAKTAPAMLWSGEFQRLPGSALRARYGDNRTYYYKDQVIDHQVHMGIDLASVARAPIPAANDGKVVFSGPLGIFGNLVVIDHGMGLMSLYSHMSRILVADGEAVKKGQIIAHTGTTGLAAGDHLHFGVLLNGVQVQPLDWLDKNWVQAAITSRIEAASKQ